MGILNDTPSIIYNKFENPEQQFGQNFTGPIVHPSITNYKKEILDVYENRTLIENNLEKMKKFANRDCLGIRKKDKSTGKFENKYTYFTYAQIEEMCKNVGKNLHVRKTEIIYEDEYNGMKFELIGIFAKNCVEWVVMDTACQLDSITTVTLYSTLGQEAFRYICLETMISTICVSPDLVDLLVEYKNKYNIISLKNAILFDFTNDGKEEASKKLQDAGFNLILFTDLMKKNDTIQFEELKISKPDTVMTICYTSGTTGNPKGVMIIQRNMISMLEICIRDSGIPLDEKGAHISFLPLAHIMERIIISGFMSVAAKIGFISGSVRTTLLEDIGLLKPTCLFLVPRVLQTFKAKIFSKFESLSFIKRKLVFKALETKKENIRKYGVLTHPIYDKIVFDQIRKTFGGELKCILSSSAPLSKDLADDFKAMLSVPIIEGWGMTELTGPAFSTLVIDHSNATAGGVISTSYMKLQDVPELGYTKDTCIDGVKCPSGEICIKGPATCLGYYKNPEENQKAFDADGFLHTGDVGCITNINHGIKIIDRVKEIFKLSQGEYIIPNKLENVYSKSKYVQNLLIYGNSLQNHIIGIIIINKKECAQFLGIEPENNEEIEKMPENEKLKEEIRNDFLQLAKEANFNSLEKLTYFILSLEEFTIENECMTPTLKLVRKKIEARYKDRINELYKTIISK